MSFKTIPLVGALLLLFSVNASAQYPVRMLEIGIGSNSYKGDLNSSFDKWAPSFHTGLRFNWEKRINLSVEGMFGKIQAQSTTYISPDPDKNPLRFVESSFWGVHAEGNLNFVQTKRWKVYLYQGVGFMRFTLKDEEGNKLLEFENISDSRADGESLDDRTIYLPTGLGAIYFLKNGFGISGKIGLLNPLTDYLDNMSELGDPDNNDMVLQGRISLLVPLRFD
ncbi:outer membrane beta-barrel protein [Limibacter armeniacum]|uniref:outer membrane beta-barrel protein n=1 Tax=Limibacter armeniacum TaxID=466084 RepID=UPI002FE5751A